MSFEADQLRVEVIKLREQLSGERGLWHCTMEDKRAMDENLRRVEQERDFARTTLEALRRDNRRLLGERDALQVAFDTLGGFYGDLLRERDRLREES